MSQDVPQRYDRDLIDRRNRSLRGRIVGPKRFDRVADELEPHRVRGRRGEHVDDAAADREFAVLVGGIFAGKAGLDEALRQVGRGDVLAGLQLQGRGQHAIGRRHARQQRRRRGHHDACRPPGHAMKRARAGRRHADVRRQTAVGIDLV